MAMHGPNLYPDKVVLKSGAVIETQDGTDIVAVSGNTASVTGTETILASEIVLARGNVLVGNSSGVGTALDANDAGKILVGDGTDLASVAVSGDATLASNGALTVTDLTLGSDAAGDMFYKTSATVTARLPKGVGFQVLRMNSGATAPEWGMVSVGALVESTTATATADGLTTGSLTAVNGLKKFVTVTSANATDAITLPGANAGTVGQEIFLTVGANGFELLTPSGQNQTINQVDSDGTNQLDVPANSTVRCTCISATAWLAETIAATSIAITAPDND